MLHNHTVKNKRQFMDANIEQIEFHYMNDYYENLFHNCGSDSKKIWICINKVLGRGRKQTQIYELLFNCSAITHKDDIANHMFFSLNWNLSLIFTLMPSLAMI